VRNKLSLLLKEESYLNSLVLKGSNNYKGENMNKSELIDAIAEEAGITKVAAGKALESLIASVTKCLKSGGSVVLPGFGSFTTDTRAARVGRNPRTGEAIQIKASRVAKFKAGKTLKEAVQ
jgi:DNA-binding protein HU-beta